MDLNAELINLKTVKDFEKLALEEKFSENSKLYISAGACSASTPTHNEDAFKKYRIRPRVLRRVSEASTECKALNTYVSCPIGISPVGMHVLAHPEAELATARGSYKEGCIFIVSSAASRTIRQISTEVPASSNGRPTLWMQVNIHKDRTITLNIIKEAESLGFSAIVVTVDTPTNGLWRKVMPRSFFQECANRLPNLPSLPRNLEDATVTFDDLKWLVESTRLPVIVKGILSGEDAMEVARCGVSAVFVSNHGGRMIERVVSPIDVLEEVAYALKETEVEVYLDGGIRSGSDVFVSLALGAKAVFVGRPAVWGLAVDGEKGVQSILHILKEELFFTMKLTGVSRIEDITRSLVTQVS